MCYGDVLYKRSSVSRSQFKIQDSLIWTTNRGGVRIKSQMLSHVIDHVLDWIMMIELPTSNLVLGRVRQRDKLS